MIHLFYNIKLVQEMGGEGRGGVGHGVAGWERRVSSQAASHSDSDESWGGRLKFVKM